MLAVAAVDELDGGQRDRARSTSTGSSCRLSSIRSRACARRTQRARSKATSGAAEAADAGHAADAARDRRAEVDRCRVRRLRRTAGCRWARRPTSGRTATSTPGSRARRSSSTRRSSTPNTSHQTLEPRTAMAYWQNGKLYIHCSTQSVVQTVGSVSRWLQHRPEGRRRSSASTPAADSAARRPGTITSMIPALLSKKLNAPVMMRIDREDRALHRRRASGGARAPQGRLREGRPHHRARHVRRQRERPVRAAGRHRHDRPHRLAALSAAGDALARRLGRSPTRRRGARRASRAACRASW